MSDDANRGKSGASLGRVFSHFKNGTFGFVSASKGGMSHKENEQRTKDLFELLKADHIAYVPVDGVYGVPEKSVFLMNIEPDALQRLAEKYEQETYIWGEKGAWVMVNTDTGAIEMDGTKFLVTSVADEEDYYSKVKGRKFKLAEE